MHASGRREISGRPRAEIHLGRRSYRKAHMEARTDGLAGLVRDAAAMGAHNRLADR